MTRKATGVADRHWKGARRVWLTVALAVWALIAACAWPASATAQSEPVTAHVFWQQGCPYCTRAKAALRDIAGAADDVVLDEIELGVDATNDALFAQI